MKRVRRSWLVAGVSAAMLLAPSIGAAFNSYPVGAPHDQITRAACADAGWNSATAGELCGAVRQADRAESRWAPGLSPTSWLRFRPNARYRPEHHFDRPSGATDAEAFQNGARYFREQAELAQTEIREGHRERAIVAAGRAAHVLQDLYAHSNLVDMSDDAVERIEASLWDPAAGADRALKLTGYDASAKDPERPEGDAYSHGEWAKDSADKNAESRSRIGEVTKFARARALAIRATERLLQRLESAAPRERWNTANEP